MINYKEKRKLNMLHRHVGLKIVALSLFLLLAGNVNQAFAFQATSDAASVLAAFNSAIYDSAVYKNTNVRPLKPLKFDPINKSTTVVTLTDFDYSEGGKFKLPFRTDMGTHYTWVSAFPEVQNLCRRFPKEDLKLNLEQLLGLQPNSSFKYFVTFEVTSGQIFRPATNPDPTTEYPCPIPKPASVSVTDDKAPSLPENCGETFPAGIDDVNYKLWFLDKTLSTYSISGNPKAEGYPWTRLGYTYNWKPGADKYGASEYVINLHSVVTVKEITLYQDYCQPTK